MRNWGLLFWPKCTGLGASTTPETLFELLASTRKLRMICWGAWLGTHGVDRQEIDARRQDGPVIPPTVPGKAVPRPQGDGEHIVRAGRGAVDRADGLAGEFRHAHVVVRGQDLPARQQARQLGLGEALHHLARLVIDRHLQGTGGDIHLHVMRDCGGHAIGVGAFDLHHVVAVGDLLARCSGGVPAPDLDPVVIELGHALVRRVMTPRPP